MSSKYRTTPDASSTMPSGIPYIIGNEAAERFSYYGMTAILFAYLTEHFKNASGVVAPMSEHQATEWSHNFFAAVYAFPIVGALVSDWLLGKYRTIVSISLLYCLGHAVLACVDYPSVTGIDPRWLLTLGLGLIAVGAGGIKPCVSAHVGDQFGTQNEHLISRVFGWFYFSINVGATVSMLLTPWLMDKYGPGWAFGVPGILMALATLVFWLGRYRYVHVPAGGRDFVRETFSADGLRAIGYMVPLFLIVMPFFCLFDQSHTSWVEQAKALDRNFFGVIVRPAQIQAVNSILVLLFVPLFSYGLYPLLGRWFEVTPLRKIGIGLFLTAGAFAIVAITQVALDQGQTPHASWQLLAFVVITAAEVLVSVTVLEFSYTQAPKRMKSLMMGAYMICSISLGNVVTAQVNGYIESQKQAGNTILQGASYFWLFTGIMAVTAFIFVVFAQFYRGRTYIQGQEYQE
jgi:POT family proton-dependent oligopeptide transporter